MKFTYHDSADPTNTCTVDVAVSYAQQNIHVSGKIQYARRTICELKAVHASQASVQNNPGTPLAYSIALTVTQNQRTESLANIVNSSDADVVESAGRMMAHTSQEQKKQVIAIHRMFAMKELATYTQAHSITSWKTG